MRLCAGHPPQPSLFCMSRDGPPITQRTSGLWTCSPPTRWSRRRGSRKSASHPHTCPGRSQNRSRRRHLQRRYFLRRSPRRPSREQCRFLPPAAPRRGRPRRYASSRYNIWRAWCRGRGTAAICCWRVPLSSHSVRPASASLCGPAPPPRRRGSRLAPSVFGQCRWRRRRRWRVCRRHRRNRQPVRNTRHSARISNCSSCWHCAAGPRRVPRRRRIERGPSGRDQLAVRLCRERARRQSRIV